MIKIYGAEGCGQCKIIRSKLDAKNIKYTYSEDRDEMVVPARKFKTMALPICVIDGEHYPYREMAEWINNYGE